MERTILWSVMVLGWVSWLYGGLITHSGRAGKMPILERIPRSYLGIAFALPILVWLVTLPGKAPYFAEGHGLGNGFLLGALGALLSGGVLLRATSPLASHLDTRLQSLSATAALTSPFALALALVPIPLLWMRSTLADSLMGIAIGWLALSTLLLFGNGESEELAETGEKQPQSTTLSALFMTGTGFAIALCALTLLGEYRGAIALTTSAKTLT